jgi:hypothetical protein
MYALTIYIASTYLINYCSTHLLPTELLYLSFSKIRKGYQGETQHQLTLDQLTIKL